MDTAIELEPDLARLLRDVQAGKVARYRRGRTSPVSEGDDRQEDPTREPSGLRPAARRLDVLRRKQLVELPRGEPDVPSWPWKTTKLGDTVLTALNFGADTAIQRGGSQACPKCGQEDVDGVRWVDMVHECIAGHCPERDGDGAGRG